MGISRHHVIISGTGRAGTTFLVQLLTSLGLETGFSNPYENIYPQANAGMEKDLRDPNAPYIVKSPWICDYIGDVLKEGDVVIDHAIIPIRELYAAAESRRRISSDDPLGHTPNIVPGGIWDAENPQDQEKVLAVKLYQLLDALIEHEVPVTFLKFPRFVNDPVYLYRKLWFLFQNINYKEFLSFHSLVFKPQLIHTFERKT